ncbi:hypothetical protein [Helicobacter sp. MIT 14-3879]|uniref:hypothetical protein n=1 Tax=Helicobacter sp. MIT 14-3879 TaxID=2040649 RepID=UPI000E1E4C24|nr:hypothetical protein [Helicobacter sp. MIT 14-3879]RDU61210.1 hypothetical protein CQA44_09825 [Helicobacter sp. MIT 14-3879]
MKIQDEKELAQALKNEEDCIEIEGNLARGTFKIKATGKIAWAVYILFAAAAAIIASRRMATPAAEDFIAFAATIAIAGGGIGVLNKLRDYKLEKISDTHIKLIK